MLLRHVRNMTEVKMSIGISSMSGSRSVDLIGSVISTMGGGGERMQLIEWSVGLGGKRGSENQRNVASASSGIR